MPPESRADPEGVRRDMPGGVHEDAACNFSEQQRQQQQLPNFDLLLDKVPDEDAKRDVNDLADQIDDCQLV